MIKTIIKWIFQEELNANQQRDLDMYILNVKLVFLTTILAIALFAILLGISEYFGSAEQLP
jgi:hypothetical protein